jgi:hypothetical protein
VGAFHKPLLTSIANGKPRKPENEKSQATQTLEENGSNWMRERALSLFAAVWARAVDIDILQERIPGTQPTFHDLV